MATITFSSVTYATKAKRALASISINAKLIKIDTRITNGNCKYGLMINNKEYLSAIRCLVDNKIPYSVTGGY